jgi:amino acid efflux transporter
VIALPALAAEVAGPASLLAWLALVLLSVPLAATFAALGARYPDAGGVATYARLAFGDRAAAVVGWCFYFAIPAGAAASALIVAGYVTAATGGGSTTGAVSGILLMAAVTGANAAGLRLAGRMQLVLAAVLVLFLLAALLLAVPRIRLDNLVPFAPHGWPAVGPAAAMLMWSFIGWEAITHLAAEFRRPARDLPRATGGAVVIVGTLYLAVAFAVVAVLGPAAAVSSAPLGELLAGSLGGNARMLAAVAAVLLTFGAMNAYYAGAANLGAALGRDGALPGWLAHGVRPGQVPRRSLTLVSGLAFAALGVVLVTGVGIEPLVLMATGSFVTVYVIGTAAAVRLLPTAGAARPAAMFSLVMVVALLLMTGRYLLWPALVTTGALLYLRLTRRGTSAGGGGRAGSAPPCAGRAGLGDRE